MPIHNNIKSIVAVKRVLANSLALGSFVGLVVATTLSQNSITSVDVMASGNPFGKSIRFHGTGTGYNDRVEIPVQNNGQSNKLNIGATDFTIEFWMKVPAGVTNTPVGGGSGWIWGNIILDRDVFGDTPDDFGLSLFNGNLRFGTGPNVDTNTIQTSGVNVADNQWHHVAIVRIASSGQVRIYVDGTQRASGNLQAGDISYKGPYNGGYINGPCNQNKDPYLVLGAEKHDYFWCAENNATKAKNNAYNGLLDDLRSSNIARYNSKFTIPNSPHPIDINTVSRYRFDDDTANDSASGPVNGVVKSGVSFDNDSPFSSSGGSGGGSGGSGGGSGGSGGGSGGSGGGSGGSGGGSGGSGGGSGGSVNCNQFSDVPTNHSFYFHICVLRHKGIVNGYGDNTYRPNNFVTRGEMAAFLKRGNPSIPNNTSCINFADLKPNSPFYLEITSLKCYNVTEGYPEANGIPTYRPNNFVTRSEMAKFIVNAFSIPYNTNCNSFSDISVNTPFYQEITTLKCHNIIDGYPDGTFKLNNKVTRGEMAKFIDRARNFKNIN